MPELAVHRRGDAGLVAPGDLVEGQRGVGGALVIGQIADAVVEAGDGESAFRIGQRGQHANEHVGGVLDATAVLPGVDVVRRPLDADLPVRDAAEPVADRRDSLVVERVAVGHDAHVGVQQVGVIVDERLDRRGADLLVTLEEEAQVHRQPAGGLDPGLGRLEVHEQLALVVADAAGEDAPVLVARLERRADPLVVGVGRLHVVVAVHQHGRRVGTRMEPIAGDDRMMRGLVDGRVLDADAGHLGRDPLCRPAHLAGAVGIGRHGLDAQELVELVEVLGVVLAEIGEGRIGHAGGFGFGGHVERMIGGIGRCNRAAPIGVLRP